MLYLALDKARAKEHVPALMLLVSVGTETESERQMLFDQLSQLCRGDVLSSWARRSLRA